MPAVPGSKVNPGWGPLAYHILSTGSRIFSSNQLAIQLTSG